MTWCFHTYGPEYHWINVQDLKMGLGGERRPLNFLNPESSKVDTFRMLQCVAVYGKTVQKRAIVVLGTDAPSLMQEFMAGRQTDSPAEGFPKKRYTVDDYASFDVPPEAEEVPRFHQLRFRSREDSSIIAVRAFLSARNRPTLRQRFHYIAVGLPRVPEDLQQHIQRRDAEWEKECHMLIAQASKATKLTEDNIKTMAKQLQSAHRSLLGTSTFFGLQVDETTDKELVPLTCIEDNTPETHEPPQPFSDTYDIASEQFQQMIHLKMTSMTISEQQRNGIAQKTRGQST
ncbi:hypothetical protein Bbelb_292390 [Branchiostoma belcheri]|nr:hypothetical protein Bbelb_292390 [Branchiostoma belcheri]